MATRRSLTLIPIGYPVEQNMIIFVSSWIYKSLDLSACIVRYISNDVRDALSSADSSVPYQERLEFICLFRWKWRMVAELRTDISGITDASAERRKYIPGVED